MLTEDRPITVGDAPTGRNHEFLFIEGDRIVGRVYADCLVCAWKAGRHGLRLHVAGIVKQLVHSLRGCHSPDPRFVLRAL